MKKALAIFALIVTLMAPLPAAAQVDVFPQCSTSGSDSAICKGGDSLFGANSIWNKILNAVTYVAGAVAVLMIIIGGFRYTVSNGDQSAITAAKNTILYAVVGLVLSIMANAIINFVLINI